MYSINVWQADCYVFSFRYRITKIAPSVKFDQSLGLHPILPLSQYFFEKTFNYMHLKMTHNLEKNGLEVRLSEKPKQALTDLLGIVGFRYSYRQMMWYAPKSSQRENFLKRLQVALDKDVDIDLIPIEPAYSPSIENIDKRCFSIVSITRENSDGLSRLEDFVLFDSSKKIAEKIAHHFAQDTFPGQAKKIEVYPRNRKKQARGLLEKGRIIKTTSNKRRPVLEIENTQQINLADQKTEERIPIDREEEPIEPKEQVILDEYNSTLTAMDSKETSTKVILDRLYKLERKEPFTYSELKDLGIRISKGAWEVRIGDYKIIRTAIFSLSYKIEKSPPSHIFH